MLAQLNGHCMGLLVLCQPRWKKLTLSTSLSLRRQAQMKTITLTCADLENVCQRGFNFDNVFFVVDFYVKKGRENPPSQI